MSGLLKDHQLHGWQPNKSLSVDENFMDLCMIITRSSKLKQGSMACILVNESGNSDGVDAKTLPTSPTGTGSADNTNTMCDSIISVANNRPLFSETSSDVHAEISAIGKAARHGLPTENATAYITMPPCKNCFGALAVAGIRRIVTRYGPNPKLESAANRNNIQWITIANHGEMMARVNAIIGVDSGEKKRKKSDQSNGETNGDGETTNNHEKQRKES